VGKGVALRVWHCTGAAQTRRRAERKVAPPVAECAVRVRALARAGATPGGTWRVRRAVAGADRLLLVWRGATVMMGDIGKEITEIELEPLPDDPPAEAPVEPTTEPVPG
jgi:hypothetical protein